MTVSTEVGRVQADDRKVAPIPVPRSEQDFSPSWFTGALSERFPGLQVVSCEMIQRIGGTASKFRFKLAYATAQGPTGAPDTLWAKGGFESGGAEQGDAFVNEVRFYRDLAPSLGINVPRAYFGAVDAETGNGVILMEDLLKRNCTFGRATAPLSFEQASAVLDMQARYHARYWNDPGLADFGWLRAGGSIAASGMVEQYFAGFWRSATALPRFRHVPERLRNRSAMSDALNRMIEGDVREAHCLVHGDSQGANLFFESDGTPGYLDWQHVMRGHWAFDLASLVVTGMTVADRRLHERSLLEAYRNRLTAYGAAPPSFDVMWRDYRLHALWAFMWVMCPVSAHPEEVCTLNAERACAAIVDLDSLAVV